MAHGEKADVIAIDDRNAHKVSKRMWFHDEYFQHLARRVPESTNLYISAFKVDYYSEILDVIIDVYIDDYHRYYRDWFSRNKSLIAKNKVGVENIQKFFAAGSANPAPIHSSLALINPQLYKDLYQTYKRNEGIVVLAVIKWHMSFLRREMPDTIANPHTRIDRARVLQRLTYMVTQLEAYKQNYDEAVPVIDYVLKPFKVLKLCMSQ